MVVSHPFPISTRDPSTSIALRDGIVTRQIHHSYAQHYEHLLESGLYRKLTEQGLLIPHKEIETATAPDVYKVLQPERVKFISYGQEWTFSQLKDAALCTLAIQKIALQFGMVLKDATTQNVQFHKGKPILIDTGSFHLYKEGEPWLAYGQFCRHFLTPLALMSFRDVRLAKLMQTHLDGIPLDLGTALLPWTAYLSDASLLFHLLFHARMQSIACTAKNVDAFRLNKSYLQRSSLSLLSEDLERAIKKLRLPGMKSRWATYYRENTYTDAQMEQKESLVSSCLDALSPQFVWDLGANSGMFSKIASKRGIETIALEIDPISAELIYLDVVKDRIDNLLPLIVDLTNPTPGQGWNYGQQRALIDRGRPDTVLALALIHHLAIALSIPLSEIAFFLARISKSLIIEFVPKSDNQVANMLSLREDIFPDYNQNGFERAFLPFFTIARTHPIDDSERIIYMMVRR
jgi:ribosomal protein L11 methylase PrmA